MRELLRPSRGSAGGSVSQAAVVASRSQEHQGRRHVISPPRPSSSSRPTRQVWFGEDFDIVDELAEVTADKLSDELKEQVLEVVDYWEKILTLGKANTERLHEALDEMDRRRVAQAELERQAAAEDAEEAERTCCAVG